MSYNKAEYAIAKGLGGTMWWSVDHDDSWGSCGQGHFPLINAVNDVFKQNTNCPGNIVTSATTTRATTQSIVTSGIQSSSGVQVTTTAGVVVTSTVSSNVGLYNDARFDCTGERQLVQHPDDCTKFIRCSNREVVQCPSGLRFNYYPQVCDWV
jgi:hypothetical protein